MNFAAGVGASEDGGIDSRDSDAEGEDEDWNEHAEEGGYPSEDEASASKNENAHASMSKSQFPSTDKNKSKGSDKPESRKAKAPNRSSSQGAMIMKQGTLSKWRSAPPTEPRPPAHPKSPIVEDILDLTGSDDDGAIPPKPGNELASDRNLARGQRGRSVDHNICVNMFSRTNISTSRQTPLRTFLQASLLSTDTETKEDDGKGVSASAPLFYGTLLSEPP